tara:strand:+ start:156 stop:377 length:222 start_codon:yes stop_codon:yes gene_type:complete
MADHNKIMEIIDLCEQSNRHDLGIYLHLLVNMFEDGEIYDPSSSDEEVEEDEDGCVPETIEIKEVEKGFYKIV